MKSIIYTLICLTILVSSLFPQDKDSLIQLYKGMGYKIEYIDREIFNIYQEIEGFEYVQLFLRDKKSLVSKIRLSKNEIFSDTAIVEDISRLNELHLELTKFKMENDEKFANPPDASVFTNAGNNYDGKLEMFSKGHLFLYSDLNYLSGNSSPFNFKIRVTSLDSLMVSVKQSVGQYVGYGAGAGFLIGFIAGYASFDDDWGAKKEVKWLISSGIGAGIGLLLGLLISESIPPDMVTINFNSPYDVIKLSDHSAYYFGYDKTLEEKYIEMK